MGTGGSIDEFLGSADYMLIARDGDIGNCCYARTTGTCPTKEDQNS